MIKFRMCNSCDWVHFPRTRSEVEIEAKSFGEYIQNQTDETKEIFGLGPLSKNKKEWDFKTHVAQMEHCFKCGNSHMNFRDSTEGDLGNITVGCTIQGIVVE